MIGAVRITSFGITVSLKRVAIINIWGKNLEIAWMLIDNMHRILFPFEYFTYATVKVLLISTKVWVPGQVMKLNYC